MRQIIDALKIKIEACKADIQHEKDYIELLRSRRPEAIKSGEIDALIEIIDDRRDTLRTQKQILRDLRDSLVYARRANGENPTDIDTFEPENDSRK